jgi:hypothetical protein
MVEEREIKSKTVQCTNGHQVRLEMLSPTPELIKTLQCPTCEIAMVVFAGDIRGAVPID